MIGIDFDFDFDFVLLFIALIFLLMIYYRYCLLDGLALRMGIGRELSIFSSGFDFDLRLIGRVSVVGVVAVFLYFVVEIEA